MSDDGGIMVEEGENKVVIGPGERLRTTREALGLSQLDCAHQLYLSDKIIHILETDDYSTHTPGPAFVRGYLRSYAKLLGLPQNEIILAFESLGIYKTPQEEVPKTLKQPNATLGLQKDKMWFYIFLTGGAFILIAVLALFILEGRQESSENGTHSYGLKQEEASMTENKTENTSVKSEISESHTSLNGNVTNTEANQTAENSMLNSNQQGVDAKIETKILSAETNTINPQAAVASNEGASQPQNNATTSDINAQPASKNEGSDATSEQKPRKKKERKRTAKVKPKEEEGAEQEVETQEQQNETVE